MKIVCIGDLHIPYHHSKSVAWALRFIKDHKPNRIILLGDCIDFYSVSRFERDPQKRDLDWELRITKEFIEQIDSFSVPVSFVVGNHEHRYQKWLWANAVELSNILPLEKLLGLPKRWEVVKYNQQVVYNDVMFFHGTKCGPALFSKNLNLGISSVQGHSHLLGCHSRRLANNKIITAASGGTLADYDVEYSTYPDWQRGLVFIEGNQITPMVSPY